MPLRTRARTKLTHLLLLGLVGPALAGCSSLLTIADGSRAASRLDCDPQFTIPRVYSGTANDLRFIRGAYQGIAIVLVDLPLSFALDTAALPYTAVTQNMYGNLCTKAERPAQ